MHKRLVIWVRSLPGSGSDIQEALNWHPSHSLPALPFFHNTKLICEEPNSHDRARRHLHKLVYAAIVIITGVWSPVSAKQKNISFNPTDMSAKALASPIIGHRGHPRQSQVAAFSCRKICCAHPSSLAGRQKPLALGWNATRDAPDGPPRLPVQGGRVPSQDFLNGFH